MCSTTKNELVLCVAHGPLTSDALTSLVQRTGSRSVDHLRRLEDEIKKATTETARTSPRDVASPATEEETSSVDKAATTTTRTPTTSDAPATIHVLVTGSPYTTQEGRTFQDWEKKWTRGEQILADVIGAIGMRNFHSVLRGGNVQMKAKLISVKENDFTMFQDPRQRLGREISWIAEYVVRHLTLSRSDARKATILYPVEDNDESDIVTTLDVINDALKREWSEKSGPLRGVDITVEAVGSR